MYERYQIYLFSLYFIKEDNLTSLIIFGPTYIRMTGFLNPVFSTLCRCDHRLFLPLCSNEVEVAIQVLVSKIFINSLQY